MCWDKRQGTRVKYIRLHLYHHVITEQQLPCTTALCFLIPAQDHGVLPHNQNCARCVHLRLKRTACTATRTALSQKGTIHTTRNSDLLNALFSCVALSMPVPTRTRTPLCALPNLPAVFQVLLNANCNGQRKHRAVQHACLHPPLEPCWHFPISHSAHTLTTKIWNAPSDEITS